MKTTTISIIGLVVSAFVALNALFIVEQTQQGIVLQFGEPKRTLQEPGLNWKIPFIQKNQLTQGSKSIQKITLDFPT